MVIVREVNVGQATYYYLFHSTKGKNFKTYARFLGRVLPSKEELEKVKADFLKDIADGKCVSEQGKNVIELLQAIQEQKGYLPEEDIVKISKELDVSAAELCGVATFYSQFKTGKPGRHAVSICRGTACHVKKSDELLKYAYEIIGVKEGETTNDGRITFDVVNCLGACAKAPVMMVDGSVYGEITKEKMKKILEELK